MKVIKWLDNNVEQTLLVIFSSIMVISISLQVFMRLFGSSLGWSEELARYCFIWLIYIGISYAVKKQRHIKVDVIVLFLKDRVQVILNMIVNIIFLALAIFIIVYGAKIAILLFGWGQTSPGMSVPMGFVYLSAPVGLGLTAIRLLQQLFKQYKYFKNMDKEDGYSINNKNSMSI
ncbi:TRAP transporter small permease [Bacilli bacterium]|uniref:TRAP transporter small permease n=1 Tax=Oceanobacillus caeni TaxID=405946 RepID=UPI00062230C6|nr:TRAP transporter small permease [Oceanobacillus caeni]KKE79627.1 C4-dicarboxylate ABC transporter [Bacilli bacterium VT-13-104]PZD89658.1 TRAP transporter small permease [Bacilli bacterium]MBU8790260.1 TRAP transporter small permease [Oceanobacillus caeni]PZD91180.1 TRAP transporter small permease [Bacilli bacterium]PZD92727.1 TRAP transporter small permease [Bacilli bacterium]